MSILPPIDSTDGLRLGQLWRYPVKSLGGEELESAELTAEGIAGDRTVHVAGIDGPLTGRTRHGLLTLRATRDDDGSILVDGHPWQSEEAAALVRAHGGDDAHLVAYDGPERFDVLDLLVATDGAVDEFGHDVRRLRPNLLITGTAPETEAGWPGHALVIGEALIGVHSMRARCVVTSIDPDTGARDPGIHLDIHRRFGGELALNCWVIRPGRLAVGMTVDVVPTTATPPRIGGWIVGAPYTAHRRAS